METYQQELQSSIEEIKDLIGKDALPEVTPVALEGCLSSSSSGGHYAPTRD